MIELWGEAVRSIEAMVTPTHRDRWLRPIECVAISDGRIRLRAPNRYHKEWFEDHYLPSILKDLQARTDATYEVEFEIDGEGDGDGETTTATVTATVSAPPSDYRPQVVSRPAGLEQRYTF